ncbi:hypothetical protein F5887DRAFT_1004076 [Amanita rubescens]|nr:hypothetical protein F5887DRAFT_1004076 [Amanita rubescens]
MEREIRQCYRHDIETLEKDRDTLKYLVLASRKKRMKMLDELRDKLPDDAIKESYGTQIAGPGERFSTLEPDVEPLAPDQEILLKAYLEHVKTTRLVREHLHDLNDDLEEFGYTVKTQAIAELTNYRGLRDWGEAMLKFTGNYTTALGTLSIAGAGLVYSTIFNATEGPVALLTLTFPLFTVGFLIPGFVYIGLGWAASVPRGMPFASQWFWTYAIPVALFIATLMVVGAIVIVNITIFELRIHQRASFTLIEAAGIISLTFSGSVIAVASMSFLVGRFFSKKMRASVLEHSNEITSKERGALNTYEHV